MNIIIDIMDYTNVLDFCKMNLRCHMDNLISIDNIDLHLTDEELELYRFKTRNAPFSKLL